VEPTGEPHGGNQLEREPPEAHDERRRYVPPDVTFIGTVADVTRGVVPTSTDGVLPGSVL
jgi:hypothetical protein